MVFVVDFFADERGWAPVEEWLSSLPLKHKAKVLALIRILEQEGRNLSFPYSSQVRGKLRELRTQQGKDRLSFSTLQTRGEFSFCFTAW